VEHDNDASLADFTAGWWRGFKENVPVTVTVKYAVIGLTNFGEKRAQSTRLADVLAGQ